jgi:hypothetical protein
MTSQHMFSIGRLGLFGGAAALMLLRPLHLDGQQPAPAVQMVGDTGEGAKYWARWRGPSGQGVVSGAGYPDSWSATENVKWKTPLPEAGNSTPIVWGDRVFVTQASGDRRLVMAFDRRDGKVLWEAGPTWTEKEPSHKTNTLCSASPATDAKTILGGTMALCAIASTATALGRWIAAYRILAKRDAEKKVASGVIDSSPLAETKPSGAEPVAG